MHTQPKQAKGRYGCSAHLLLVDVRLPLLSQHHSTALTSPKRYGNRYEGGPMGQGDELRRIHLPRRWVNKGPGPVGGDRGVPSVRSGAKWGAYPVQATIRLKGWSAGCPPETVFTTTVLLFLDYDMVGKPTPAPRAGCDGFLCRCCCSVRR